MLLAARDIGLHPNTLYKCSAGISVSADSRRKIESAFGMTLEELQRPIVEMEGVA